MLEPDALLSPQEQAGARLAIAGVARRAAQPLAAARAAGLPWQAVAVVALLHQGLDRVARAADADPTPPALRPACRPGCHACCSARVEVSEPEALWIAQWITRETAQAQESRKARLQAQAVARNGSAESALQTLPCAFLDDGLCSLYDHRPAVCRKAHALSADACHDGAATVPQNLHRVLQSDVLMAGTRQAYAQHQLASGALELAAAVLSALSTPDALERWWQGSAALVEPVTPAPPGSPGAAA